MRLGSVKKSKFRPSRSDQIPSVEWYEHAAGNVPCRHGFKASEQENPDKLSNGKHAGNCQLDGFVLKHFAIFHSENSGINGFAKAKIFVCRLKELLKLYPNSAAFTAVDMAEGGAVNFKSPLLPPLLNLTPALRRSGSFL
jgi:hypothetical protein